MHIILTSLFRYLTATQITETSAESNHIWNSERGSTSYTQTQLDKGLPPSAPRPN